MERLRQHCLTLNVEKCLFNVDRLVFIGILLSEKRIGPTLERVRALQETREPAIKYESSWDWLITAADLFPILPHSQTHRGN